MSQILTFILYFALFQSCTKVVSFKCIKGLVTLTEYAKCLTHPVTSCLLDVELRSTFCITVLARYIVMFYFIGMLLIISPRKHDLSSFVDIKLGLYM